MTATATPAYLAERTTPRAEITWDAPAWEHRLHDACEDRPEDFAPGHAAWAARHGYDAHGIREYVIHHARVRASELTWAIRWARGQARMDASLSSGRLFEHFAPEGARRTIATRQVVFPSSYIGVPHGPETRDGRLPQGSEWLERRLDESDQRRAEFERGDAPRWAQDVPSWRGWMRERMGVAA